MHNMPFYPFDDISFSDVAQRTVHPKFALLEGIRIDERHLVEKSSWEDSVLVLSVLSEPSSTKCDSFRLLSTKLNSACAER
jgi:hypothetical protein